MELPFPLPSHGYGLAPASPATWVQALSHAPFPRFLKWLHSSSGYTRWWLHSSAPPIPGTCASWCLHSLVPAHSLVPKLSGAYTFGAYTSRCPHSRVPTHSFLWCIRSLVPTLPGPCTSRCLTPVLLILPGACTPWCLHSLTPTLSDAYTSR